MELLLKESSDTTGRFLTVSHSDIKSSCLGFVQEKVVMHAVSVGACKATIVQVAHRLQSVVGSDRCGPAPVVC